MLVHPTPGPALARAGGYAVLKGIQERLTLPTDTMIPSFATLREYGEPIRLCPFVHWIWS
jgi:hypothetical protein